MISTSSAAPAANSSAIPSVIVLAVTLLLHLAVIAWVLSRLSDLPAKPVEPPPVTIALLPAKATAPTVVPQKPQQPKQKTVPVPIKQTAKPAPEAKIQNPTLPANPAAPSPSAAPAAPVAQAAPPAAPAVKSDVSVNASAVEMATVKFYPTLSRRYGDEGTVILHLTISATGRAEKVELKKSSGNPLLDNAAIALAKELKYIPATLNGKPVADETNLSVPFKLKD